MIIHKLELLNFGQFYGKQEILFADGNDNSQLVTVICGKDEIGKISLCRALFFGLYGEYHLDRDLEYFDGGHQTKADKAKGLVNLLALKEDALGEQKGVEAYVKVGFSHQNKKYEIFRTLSGIQKKDGRIVEQMEELTLTIMDDKGKIQLRGLPDKETITQEMNAILDSQSKSYFFFDSKRMERCVEAACKREIQKITKTSFRVDGIYLAAEAFQILAKKLLDELANIPVAAYEKIVEERSALQNHIAELTDRQRHIDQEKAQNFALLQQLDAQRDKFRDAMDLLREIKEKEGERQRLLELKQEVMQDFRQFLPTAVQLLARDLLAEIYQDIDDKREKGQVTPATKKELVEKILSDMTCICGRKVTLGSEEYTRLLQWAEGAGTALSSNVAATFASLSNTIRFLNGKLEESFRLLQHISDIDAQYSSVTNRLEQTNRELEKYPEIEILNNINDKRNQRLNKLAEYENETNRLTDELTAAEFRLGELESEWKKKEKELLRYQEVQEMKKFVDRSCEVMKKIVIECSGEIKTALEQEANRNLQSLAYDANHKAKSRLVMTQEGTFKLTDCPERLFAAEASLSYRKIVALSVAIAFAQVASGEHVLKFPVFLNVPLGHLTNEHQENMFRYLSKIAPQWIFFADDSFHPDAGKRLFSTGTWGKLYLLEAAPQEVINLINMPVEAYRAALDERCGELSHDEEQRLEH